MGSVDELNSQLGVLIADLKIQQLDELALVLAPVQHRLFDLGGELAVPGYEIIEASDVTELEDLIDHFNASLEPLKNFILPGGSRCVAAAHLARSICRRAERRYLTLANHEAVNEHGVAVFVDLVLDRRAVGRNLNHYVDVVRQGFARRNLVKIHDLSFTGGCWGRGL